MAIVGLVGVGMNLVVGKHVRKSQEGLVTCQEMPENFLSAK